VPHLYYCEVVTDLVKQGGGEVEGVHLQEEGGGDEGRRGGGEEGRRGGGDEERREGGRGKEGRSRVELKKSNFIPV